MNKRVVYTCVFVLALLAIGAAPVMAATWYNYDLFIPVWGSKMTDWASKTTNNRWCVEPVNGADYKLNFQLRFSTLGGDMAASDTHKVASGASECFNTTNGVGAGHTVAVKISNVHWVEIQSVGRWTPDQ